MNAHPRVLSRLPDDRLGQYHGTPNLLPVDNQQRYSLQVLEANSNRLPGGIERITLDIKGITDVATSVNKLGDAVKEFPTQASMNIEGLINSKLNVAQTSFNSGCIVGGAVALVVGYLAGRAFGRKT